MDMKFYENKLYYIDRQLAAIFEKRMRVVKSLAHEKYILGYDISKAKQARTAFKKAVRFCRDLEVLEHLEDFFYAVQSTDYTYQKQVQAEIRRKREEFT